MAGKGSERPVRRLRRSGGAGDDGVIMALTLPAVPTTGTLDREMLYRMLIASERRIIRHQR
jgi:hypothetical protein